MSNKVESPVSLNTRERTEEEQEKLSQDNTETPAATESTDTSNTVTDSHQDTYIDYAPYLEKAASMGTVLTRISSLGLFGAAGTGKTSTLRLIRGQPPIEIHDSTPILEPEEYFSNDGKVHSNEQSDNYGEDNEWDSGDELDPPTQSTAKLQTVSPVKQVLLISNATSNEWKPATQEVMIERLANCTVTALELEKMAIKGKATSLLIEGFAMTKKKNQIERDPAIDIPLEDDNGATPKLLSKQSSASSACNEISEEILKFLESNQTLKPLGITHFVSICDTGGQAAFLDLAPAFLRYNSTNLILLKLDENLDDPAQFFYSVKGVRVGDEKRQISTRALVRSFVSLKSKIRKSNIKGMKVIYQHQKPKFMILGTHFDKYIKKIGECQSKEEKNQVLREDLAAFGDSLYANSKKKIMFSLDTLARDKATKTLASKIRKLVMENYTEAEIPVSWYIFQLAMYKIKSSNENHEGMIRLSTLIDIGTITRMPREEVKASLLYFHDLQVCLYLPTVVPNVVFTNPQFLLDKISEMIAFTFCPKVKNGMTDGEVQNLIKCGIFTEKFLKKVCTGFEEDFLSSGDFLALMSHLFVVCSLPNTDEYFMPCILATHPNPCEDFSKCSVKPLALAWDKSVPNGLFPLLTTKIQARNGINYGSNFTMSRVEQQYRNRITLDSVDLGCKVTLVECTSFIAASINTCIPQSPGSVSRYVTVRGVILRCINDIVVQLDWVQAEPEECFICDMCPSDCPVHLCFPDETLTVLSCCMTQTTAKLTASHLAWRKEKGHTASTYLTIESAFKLLKTKSAQWDSIGAAFGISLDARQSLRRDSSMNDTSRLEHVLAKWLDSSAPTWSDFMNVIKSLKFNDVAEQVKSLISNENRIRGPTVMPHDETNMYIETFERCVKNKESTVSYLMVQVIPFGPPRVGKTCLYQRLLDKELYSKRTPDIHQPGEGSLSTNVLSQGKMVVSIKNESAKAIFADRSIGKWNEISSLENQVALCMKTTHAQQQDESDEVDSNEPKASSEKQTTMKSSKNSSDRMLSTAQQQSASSSNDENEPSTDFDDNDEEHSSDDNNDEERSSDDDNDEEHSSDEDQKTNDPSPDSKEPTCEPSNLKCIVDKIRNCKNVDQLNSVTALLEDSLMIYFTDTGGQPEFHEILPALVAGPTVFLLVFSLIKSLNDLYEVDYESSSNDFKKYCNSFTVREVLMGCLSSISCFKAAQAQDLRFSYFSSNATDGSGNVTDGSRVSQLSEPPIRVLVVGTHNDLVGQKELREINKSLYDELDSSDLLKNVIAQYDSDEQELLIPVDNFNPKDGVKLRKFFDRVVYSTRGGVNSYKITLPVNWLGFELSLKMLESATIKYADCIALIKEFNMQNEMELKSCLHFLHYKIGTIRYYGRSVPELEDTVIIKPEVIFAAVTEFITRTFSSHNVSQEVADDFRYYGLFKKKDVEAVFNMHKKKLEITLEQFLALLQHLNILSEWQQDDKNKDNYFFPCALTHIIRDDEVDNNKSDPLLVCFDSGFLPKGVFSGVLAVAFKKWRISKKKNKPELYRNQAIFYLTHNNSTITIKATAKYLEISQQYNPPDDNPSNCAKLSIEILSELSRALKDVCKKLGYGNKFCGWKFGFYCCTSLTGCCDSDDRHFAAVSEDQEHLICSHTARSFMFDNRQHWHEGIKRYSSHIGEKMVQENEVRIKNCVALHPEYKDAQGIIFIIRMFGAPGTTKNVEQIHSTFRNLNFAVLTFSDPTAAAIASLMKAAGSYPYPKNIKYIGVYYTGYGGIECGAQYVVPLQTNGQQGESECDVLYVDEKIVQPLRKSELESEYKRDRESECRTRFFLFHCSNINKKPLSRGETIKPASKGEIIAFTTSESHQDDSEEELSTGWTNTFCKNIRQQDKSIVTILKDTAKVSTGQDIQKVEIFTYQEAEMEDLKFASSDNQAILQPLVDSSHQTNDQHKTNDKLDRPTPAMIFKLLKLKSVKWEEIGREAGVDLNYREILQSSSNITCESKLERVIARWNEQTPITWKSFMDVLLKLKFNDVIIELPKGKGYIQQQNCICDSINYSDLWKKFAASVKLEVDNNDQPSSSSDIEKFKSILKKCMEKIQSGTPLDNEVSQSKPVTVQAVCSALKEYSSHWNDFACELEVDDEYRDTLERVDSSLSDEEKLKKIIERWIEKETCEVSWNKIIVVTGKELKFETKKLEEARKICLMKPKVRKKVFDCLKDNSSCWSDLAQELEIDDSLRDKLEHDTSINDRRKLEKVIQEWLDENKGYKPTWEKIIGAVKELKLTAEVCKLKTCSEESS